MPWSLDDLSQSQELSLFGLSVSCPRNFTVIGLCSIIFFAAPQVRAYLAWWLSQSRHSINICEINEPVYIIRSTNIWSIPSSILMFKVVSSPYWIETRAYPLAVKKCQKYETVGGSITSMWDMISCDLIFVFTSHHFFWLYSVGGVPGWKLWKDPLFSFLSLGNSQWSRREEINWNGYLF